MSGAAAQAGPLGLLRLLVQALLPDATVPSRHCPPRQGDECALTTRLAGPRSLRCLGPDRPGGLLWYAHYESCQRQHLDFSTTSRLARRPAAHGCFTAAFFSTRTPAMRTAWDAALERVVNDRGRVAHAPIP